MVHDVLLFWLVHLIIGILIPLMVYCDRCDQEAREKELVDSDPSQEEGNTTPTLSPPSI